MLASPLLLPASTMTTTPARATCAEDRCRPAAPVRPGTARRTIGEDERLECADDGGVDHGGELDGGEEEGHVGREQEPAGDRVS